MTCVFRRGSMLYNRVKTEDGSWTSHRTGLRVGEEEAAGSLSEMQQKLFEMPTSIVRCDLRKSTRAGWLYVVRLEPKRLPRRIKVGFTRNVRDRVGSFTTTNPHAQLAGAWHADERDEQVVLRLLKGRIGKSEVFDCQSVHMALLSIDLMLCGEAKP